MTDLQAPSTEVTEMVFGGLRIRYDDRVLTPRSWTLLQSRWAAELLESLPTGRVLELCCGAGQIGLAAVADTSRGIVCVDRDPVAVAYATSNAARAGLADRVEVREAALDEAVGGTERFALVIADPPWVRSDETGRFPRDPVGAIDGGPDGLDVARLCLQVAAGHLTGGGAALIQLGSVEQAETLRPLARSLALDLREIRVGRRGVIVLFAQADGGGCEAG
jgi:release factor glutamine methyltransferase